MYEPNTASKSQSGVHHVTAWRETLFAFTAKVVGDWTTPNDNLEVISRSVRAKKRLKGEGYDNTCTVNRVEHMFSCLLKMTWDGGCQPKKRKSKERIFIKGEDMDSPYATAR